MKFQGFGPGFPDLLVELDLAYDSGKLENYKDSYKRWILQPLHALYEDLLPTALEVSGTVESKPHRCVSTMYRDMRFSRGNPLKTYMYLRFRESGEGDNVPGLFFDMGYEHYAYGIRIYRPNASGTAAVREDILSRPKAYAAVLVPFKASGFRFIGEKYFRDRFPEQGEPHTHDLLNHKHFYVSRERPVSPSVFTPALGEELRSGFKECAPFYRLLKEGLQKR